MISTDTLGPYVAQVGRARGARGPLTLRLAGTPERWIERNNEQRKSYLSTGGFQLTDQISGIVANKKVALSPLGRNEYEKRR